ncbi:MAG: hypothetical protein APF78_09320 [Sphingomonadales bacterium BRH_c3]|nr:MAG: hypothetical protein APF78_09320 [Sphingomonadales bacterium BRH_c3]
MADQAPTEERADDAPEKDEEEQRSTIYMLWPEVMRESTLSKTVIQRLMKRGKFPLPVQLSPNRVAWVRSEFEEWDEAKKRERALEVEAA